MSKGPYDAFLSYRHADKDWVRKTLVPRLESAGLRLCVDYRDFKLGAALLDEMERAVLEYRFTIAVHTKAYSESGFTDLENILADHRSRTAQRSHHGNGNRDRVGCTSCRECGQDDPARQCARQHRQQCAPPHDCGTLPMSVHAEVKAQQFAFAFARRFSARWRRSWALVASRAISGWSRKT